MLGALRKHVAANDFVISFPDASAPETLQLWQEKLSRLIATMSVEPVTPERYSTFWRHIDFGGLQYNLLESGSQRVVHSGSMTRLYGCNSYDLLYLLRNDIQVNAGGKCFPVREGNFVFLNHASPYSFASDKTVKAVTLHFGRDWAQRWIPDPDGLEGREIDGVRGWAAPMGALLRTIAHNDMEAMDLPRSLMSDQIGSLLSLMAWHSVTDSSTHRYRKLEDKIRRIVREYFDCPGLTADFVAQKAGISKRYLFTICAAAGYTFSDLLMGIRLKHAENLLRDERYQHHRVCDVALASGFSDASHFTRRFKQRYGVSPNLFRSH